MNLTPYVENLRREFLLAAEAAGEEARGLAERLAGPLDSAARLTLLNALSTAADEISRDLAPGSVDLRLRGLDPSFMVTPPPVDAAPAPEEDDSAFEGMLGHTEPVGEGEGAPARINFRPPEHLKARIEEAANREGLSVNAWLIRAVSATLNAGTRRPDRRPPSGQRHHTGWVR